MNQAQPEPRSASLLVALLVASALVALGLLGSAIPLVMSPMLLMSGDPHAEGWFTALWLMPVVMIVGLLSAWIAYAARAPRLSVAALAVAAVPLSVIAAMLGYVFVS